MSEFQSLVQKDGAIYIENDRMILTSSSVFGTLRKELIENIGMDRVKGFLLRYGWNLGANDAKKVLNKNLSSIEEFLRQGPILHMIKGYTKVNTKKLSLSLTSDKKVESVYVEGEWYNSYEAEEHIHQFGNSIFPTCHTLIGYASGYYSTICGHTVIFKEISCKASGNEQCKYIGKSIHSWGKEADEELKYYENTTIIKELERTYETLLEERNNLSMASDLNKKLTQELINGKGLQSITNVVFKVTNTPILIEDIHFNHFAYAGFSSRKLEMIQHDFSNLIEEMDLNALSRVKRIKADNHYRLMTPIMLQRKLLGYCSFIYDEEMEAFPDIDYMLLERISSVTSLFLLNEKTSFEAMERMKGHFLEQVLNGQFQSKKEILNRGRYIHVDLELPYYIVILKYPYMDEFLQKELLFHEEIVETTIQYFNKNNANVIIGQHSGNNVLFVQTENDIQQLCELFSFHLQTKYKGSSFRLGISSITEDITEASTALQEAISALEMTDQTNKVMSFDRLGIVGMLVHAKDDQAVLRKAKNLLEPLLTKEPELIKTLYVFLKNGGNLEQTMEDLAISKSGLRYRIQKIENLINQEIRNPEVSYQLQLCMHVLILKGEIKILQ